MLLILFSIVLCYHYFTAGIVFLILYLWLSISFHIYKVSQISSSSILKNYILKNSLMDTYSYLLFFLVLLAILFSLSSDSICCLCYSIATQTKRSAAMTVLFMCSINMLIRNGRNSCSWGKMGASGLNLFSISIKFKKTHIPWCQIIFTHKERPA